MLYKLIGTSILASALLFAQGPGGGEGRGGGGGVHGGEGNTSMAPFSGNSRLDRISEVLQLSKDQKKNFKATMDQAQKEAAPIHGQLVKERQAIAEAVAAGKSQDEITPMVSANSALEAQIASIELKAFSTFYKGLNEEQQNKPVVGQIFLGMKGIFDGKNWNSLDY